ncbi:tetratricopeptide repeat protein [uncultured Mucilaginibacter sp.]|uniref:tetratricopeptide repeat protein n=1 Tax=uncultured Mucilaginibacter sp. TaxID=797541 RepID=UPI0025DD9BDF|nr:tetratricopeptide repeat protein [uncultured Mucilaginibacter sp.]
MPNNNISEDLKPAIASSRDLAILWKHGFINYDHIFLAILKQKCMASDYLIQFDTDQWEKKVKESYPAKSRKKGSIPLTLSAERVLKHALKIAPINNETNINTVHVLLAILSCDNEVTSAFNKAGMTITDITLPYFKREIKQFPRLLKPIRDKAYTRMEIFFSAIWSKKKKLGQLYTNAVDLYHYRQYNDSVKSCQVALAFSPGNAMFRAWMAYNKIKLKENDAAIDLLTELLKEQPDQKGHKFNLSYLLDVKGNYPEAAALLDGLLLEEPKNDLFLNNRGFNLLRQKRYTEAMPFFEKAIKENPNAPYPQNNLGFTKYNLGDLNEGLALIDCSLKLDKGNSYAYRNKGIIFMEQGDKTEARKNFKLALKFGFTEKYDNEVERLLADLGVDDQI